MAYLAHFVRVNTFDKIIHVRDGASVHKSLLCNISGDMDDHLKAYEESEEASSSEPNSKDAPRDSLRLLPDPCELSSKRAVQMWTGFLYGQPLWTDLGKDKTPEDFKASIAVYNFAGAYKHHWAQDAALDAIREMLCDHSEVLGDMLGMMARFLAMKSKFRRLLDLLEDFAVGGEDAERIERWANSSDDDEDANVFAFKEELLIKFAWKTEDRNARNAGRPGEPHLMEDECRCHLHKVKEDVGGCYLAGESAGLAGESTGGP